MEHGQTVFRDRPKLVPDPYNPARQVPSTSYDDADELELEEGAYVASSSSSTSRDATRTQRLTEKSLYCDPDEDVQAGDRIRVGGFAYLVDARPQADINPFTGWQPYQEIPLLLVEG